MNTESTPLLSIVVPVFDEELRVVRGVETLMGDIEQSGVDAELLIVDDGSRDATPRLIEELCARFPRAQAITLPTNQGKGAAVRAGMHAARGRYRLFSDVDQSTPLAEWTRLRDAIDRGHDLAIASREITGAQRLRDRWHRRQMGNVFRLLRDIFVVEGFIDSQCGFKLFSAAAAETIFRRARLDRFCFDVELLAIAAHHGLSAIEVPVTWTDDHQSKVNAVTDSLSMLKDLWRIRRFRARGLYD
jgi:dolichyl-phosphate beta-glucosyltransferase